MINQHHVNICKFSAFFNFTSQEGGGSRTKKGHCTFDKNYVSKSPPLDKKNGSDTFKIAA